MTDRSTTVATDSGSPMDEAPSARTVQVMTVLIWITTAAIFVQAILAGQFVSQDHKDGWITAHGVVADISWVMTLISAGFAVLKLRKQFPVLARWSVVLFVVTLLQTGLGHLITDGGMDWLIMIHVPLAFVVFAAAGYLSVWGVRVRRQVAEGHLHKAVEVGVDPLADVHHVVHPVDPT